MKKQNANQLKRDNFDSFTNSIMVKRSTEFKQMYLVDGVYFNQEKQNIKNSISNNQHLSVSIPEANEYPNVTKQLNSNMSTYHKATNERINQEKTDENYTDQNNSIQSENEGERMEFEDDNHKNEEKDHETSDKTMKKNPTFDENNSSLRMKKNIYKCFICKRNFATMLLLEKHLTLKHNRITKPKERAESPNNIDIDNKSDSDFQSDDNEKTNIDDIRSYEKIIKKPKRKSKRPKPYFTPRKNIEEEDEDKNAKEDIEANSLANYDYKMTLKKPKSKIERVKMLQFERMFKRNLKTLVISCLIVQAIYALSAMRLLFLIVNYVIMYRKFIKTSI